MCYLASTLNVPYFCYLVDVQIALKLFQLSVLPLYPLTLYLLTPTPWPGSAKYGSVWHYAPTDKLSKGDNQHCTLILGEKSRSTSWGLVIRCVARCPLNMHSRLHITLVPPPSVLLLPVSSPPNNHSHPSTSQKHLLTTSLTPPQQSGVNQLPVQWTDVKQQGLMTWQGHPIGNSCHTAAPPSNGASDDY